MRLEDFYKICEHTGAKSAHVRLLARGLLRGTLKARANLPFPKALEDRLPDICEAFEKTLKPLDVRASEDLSSKKFLFELPDGNTIESVLLPRDAFCVSTQVGCAVGCLFCQTGTTGLIRQLDALEIIAQVAFALRERPSTKRVVFMGMGEPSHNLKNVLDSVDFLADFGEFAHKELVISSVGDKRLFDTLMTRKIKPALAISLHTTDDNLRAKLLPKAPKIPIADLFEAAERYATLSHYPIQFEWTLMEGVNDSEADIERLIALLKNRFAMVNFIAYNPGSLSRFSRPSREKMVEIVKRVRASGAIATIRDSAAQTIDGGCGQLRARVIPIKKDSI
ncbi:MAG TPA: rRNA methyltransferase [Sutterella sp.]|nr:rRNA methyltransferase [Sutterella sp.]